MGQEYARAGAVGKAEKLAEAVSASVDPRNSEDAACFRILQAELAVAKGDADAAIKSLLALESETSSGVRTVRAEALAHAYQQSGDTGLAIAWLEKLQTPSGGGSVSWEPQEHWLVACVTLASDYSARGDKQKAKATLETFLNLWKDADSNLPLLKQARGEYAKLR